MNQKADPFLPTRWTIVLGAQAGSTQALADLVSAYRTPIVNHLIRHLGPNDGEDAAQDYLAGLLKSNYLAKASREHGRFRAFLLHDIRYFILGRRRMAAAEKRGGGLRQLSYEIVIEEGMQIKDVGADWQAERFDRDWTHAVLERVREELRTHYSARGLGERFDALAPFIMMGGQAADYEKVAEKLDMTPNAVTTAATRLRDSFAKRLRDHIAQSLAPGESVEEELAYLRSCYVGASRNDGN